MENQTQANVSNAVEPTPADTAAQLTVVAALASEPGPRVRDELEFRVAAAIEGASRRLPSFVLLMLVELFEFVERLPSEVLAGHIETFRKGFEAGGGDGDAIAQLVKAAESYGNAVKAAAVPPDGLEAAPVVDAPQPGLPGHGHWRG